ncbi:MAG: hypothetical protein BWY76_00758 [bacterium ADurb.Bin429]|nr:MAG: hypothetical protein BWY76_00758 [bacterium ADurb.Bin429]
MAKIHLHQRVAEWFQYKDISYVYRVTLSEVTRTAPAPHPDLCMIVCDASNLFAVEQMLPRLPPIIGKYVRDGNLAFLAAIGDEWIFRSVAILGPRIYSVHGYPLALTAHDVFLEAAETHPAWRGKGVAPGMLRVTAEALIARGYTTGIMTISTDNTASCRAAEKGGAQRIGKLTAQRRFGRWHTMLEPALAVPAGAREERFPRAA